MILFFILLSVDMNLAFSGTGLKSGEYKLHVEDNKQCMVTRGLGPVKTNITFLHHPNGTIDVFTDSSFSKNVGPLALHFKLSYIYENNRKKVFYEDRIPNLCKSFLTKQIMKVYEQVTDECYMSKGHYSALLRDISANIKQYLGHQFIYGVYQLRLVTFSEQLVISCLDFKISIKE